MKRVHVGEDAIDKEMHETLESQNASNPLNVEPGKTLLRVARLMHDTSSR